MISEEQKRQVREGFIHQGYYILDEFISTHECESLLSTIHQFRQKHQITEIHREMKPRSLHYFVINGEDVEEFLPDILHLSRDVHTLVQEVVAANLHPLENKKVSVNINITPPGGEYRWHYDRNALTILIYLNTVSGGEIEFCPNYRLFLPGRSHTSLQKWLDIVLQLALVRRLFGKPIVVKPSDGRMVMIRGNRTLHSVRSVKEAKERINIVLSYDTDGTKFIAAQGLDAYIYTNESVSSDPNYT